MFFPWLPLIFELLGNMYIAIICGPVCDVINFKAYLSFLIKPISYMPKISRQNFKYLKNEKIF